MEIDLSRLDARTRAAVDGKFQDKFHRDLAAAITRQTGAARAARQRPHRWADDLGPQTLIVDPFIDAVWSEVYGPNWREHPDVIRFLKNRNPEITGQSRSAKVQVGYTPGARRAPRPAKRGCRFDWNTIQFAS
jgi:hypothetical protein